MNALNLILSDKKAAMIKPTGVLIWAVLLKYNFEYEEEEKDMAKTVCGCDCEECGGMKSGCKGCSAISVGCIVAQCCNDLGRESCEECRGACELKDSLINEFNALGIEDMETVTQLNALSGGYINLEYTMPSGQRIKLLDENKIYLGNQLCKKESDRCYGLAADKSFLLVCEYGDQGADAEIVVYKRRDLPN